MGNTCSWCLTNTKHSEQKVWQRCLISDKYLVGCSQLPVGRGISFKSANSFWSLIPNGLCMWPESILSKNTPYCFLSNPTRGRLVMSWTLSYRAPVDPLQSVPVAKLPYRDQPTHMLLWRVMKEREKGTKLNLRNGRHSLVNPIWLIGERRSGDVCRWRAAQRYAIAPCRPHTTLGSTPVERGPQNTTLGSKRPKNNTLGSTPVNKGRKNTSLATTPVENGPKMSAPLFTLFYLNKRLQRFTKGWTRWTPLCYFFPTLCLVLVKRVDFAIFRRFQFCATFRSLNVFFKTKSRGNDQNFPLHPAGCSLNPYPDS